MRGNDGVMNDILADLQSNTNPNPEEIHLLKVLTNYFSINVFESVCSCLFYQVLELI